MHFIDALTALENKDESGQLLLDEIAQSLQINSKQLSLRLKQLRGHYFCRDVENAETWSDIPANMREPLHKLLFSPVLEPIAIQEGDFKNDVPTTIKTLWRLNDGERVESVLMHYSGSPQNEDDFKPDEFDFDFDDDEIDTAAFIELDSIISQGLKEAEKLDAKANQKVFKPRTTLCISSQVGCAMNCPFCATGMLGLKRNLTLPEMLEQIRIANNESIKRGWGELTNVVFMGEGEPTQNLDTVLRTVEILNNPAPLGFSVSASKITVSTVGIVEGMKAFAAHPLQFRLALSLHAPTNELRNQLVPMNKSNSVEDVIKEAYQYFITKKKRISIEYALMGGINDSDQMAFTLAKQLNRMGSNWAHVNLIALNEVEGSAFHPATKEQTDQFLKILNSKGVVATLRNSRGQDIDAACGQLAAREI